MELYKSIFPGKEGERGGGSWPQHENSQDSNPPRGRAYRAPSLERSDGGVRGLSLVSEPADLESLLIPGQEEVTLQLQQPIKICGQDYVGTRNSGNRISLIPGRLVPEEYRTGEEVVLTDCVSRPVTLAVAEIPIEYGDFRGTRKVLLDEVPHARIFIGNDLQFLSNQSGRMEVHDFTHSQNRLPENKGRETSAMKADHLRARNMKRYINQLTVAKKQCEKRIRLLGGPAYDQSEDIFEDSDGPQNQKILQFEDILCNPSYREHFQIYMERMDKKVLVSFWESVEYLKNANKAEIPQLVSQIYQDFFVESREIPVEKSLYKDIQQSLVGNRGIDVFYKIQTHVYETLKDRYYPSFIVSDLYERLIKKEEERSPFQMTADDKEEVMQTCEEVIDEGSSGINEQASYAINKLRQLNDKLEYKRQALNSLCSSPKPDKKIVSKLKDEIILMEREHSDLQLHIERTDLWCENLGMWKAFVNTGEIIEENGEQVPCYSVMVILQEIGSVETKEWRVLRKLSEFQNLHRKLSECFPSLKKAQLPSLSKLPFKSVDQKFMEKSKNQLNNFLQKLLSDERLCQSEALYAFLSPSPEYLKVVDVQEKKSSFSLSSFLERLPGDFFSHQEEEVEDNDLCDYGDDVEGKRDALAEPCFMLIGEIFELRGMFKWVRKTLIALVQITFGRTINKQICDTVNWIFSEPMLVYYINKFRDAFWPNGKLAPSAKPKSKEQSQEIKHKAQQKLLENIPDTLQNLVGHQNARYGIIKVFSALQESKANKHLLYVLLEMLLTELCPELRIHLEKIKATQV